MQLFPKCVFIYIRYISTMFYWKSKCIPRSSPFYRSAAAMSFSILLLAFTYSLFLSPLFFTSSSVSFFSDLSFYPPCLPNPVSTLLISVLRSTSRSLLSSSHPLSLFSYYFVYPFVYCSRITFFFGYIAN